MARVGDLTVRMSVDVETGPAALALVEIRDQARAASVADDWHTLRARLERIRLLAEAALAKARVKERRPCASG